MNERKNGSSLELLLALLGVLVLGLSSMTLMPAKKRKTAKKKKATKRKTKNRGGWTRAGG